jgi:hypothetical protein
MSYELRIWDLFEGVVDGADVVKGHMEALWLRP